MSDDRKPRSTMQRQQRLVRIARLMALKKDRFEIIAELGIAQSTLYRDLKSDDYKAVVESMQQPALVPADHPDMVAARDTLANSALEVAEMVSAGSKLCITELMLRIRNPDCLSNRDLIAATKLMLDEHWRRTQPAGAKGADGSGDDPLDDEAQPQTPEQVAAYLAESIPADVLKAALESVA